LIFNPLNLPFNGKLFFIERTVTVQEDKAVLKPIAEFWVKEPVLLIIITAVKVVLALA
jgi:hypothetical protein